MESTSFDGTVMVAELCEESANGKIFFHVDVSSGLVALEAVDVVVILSKLCDKGRTLWATCRRCTNRDLDSIVLVWWENAPTLTVKSA